MSTIRFYRYLMKKLLLSWRMLAVLLGSLLIMDTFLAPLRTYCREMNVKMTPWGFALIWENRYVGMSFLLIYIFAVAVIPEDRGRDCYIISRIGVSRWVCGQSLFLITFAWIYTFSLVIIQNVLLLGFLEFSPEWGNGWASLTDGNIIERFQIYTMASYLGVSNYKPLQANLLIILIMGLLLGMTGMLVFWLNLYSRFAGAFGGTVMILLSLGVDWKRWLLPFSPLSWLSFSKHYRISEPENPTLTYILGMLFLFTLLFWFAAVFRANATQENNRRK